MSLDQTYRYFTDNITMDVLYKYLKYGKKYLDLKLREKIKNVNVEEMFMTVIVDMRDVILNVLGRRVTLVLRNVKKMIGSENIKNVIETPGNRAKNIIFIKELK